MKQTHDLMDLSRKGRHAAALDDEEECTADLRGRGAMDLAEDALAMGNIPESQGCQEEGMIESVITGLLAVPEASPSCRPTYPFFGLFAHRGEAGLRAAARARTNPLGLADWARLWRARGPG